MSSRSLVGGWFATERFLSVRHHYRPVPSIGDTAYGTQTLSIATMMQ
jgi:hypothetical protein